MSRTETSRKGPRDLKLGDVDVFVQVVQAGSITGAARAIAVGPPQVSKAIARLERHLGVELMTRSPQGIELSDAGRRLAPELIELLTRARQLESFAEGRELVVAAPSFLWVMVAPRLGSVLERARVHALELRSNTMGAFASRPLFDAAFMAGEERWPGSWTKARAGVLRRALFATPAKARQLGSAVRRERVQREVFVGRFDTDQGRLLPAVDGCPLADRERRFGHRAQTVAIALELARRSGQLVFAPAIAARTYVRDGSLVEIAVEGWDVRDSMYVVCHQDRVGAKVQRALVAAVRTALEDR
jgi:DNA-binding transcriptional LysR family regulator